ncbi:hypothetical protein [Paenibacillus eucommiae]|uniref:DNA mismatch repair protein n=1 Tax=Paenibacillus eucommiae TaxID=1355755 RepID=A0ABS4ITT1_9BACL|nr:hypothetical protein [Paenibacillus eucommiae]MBP1990987.1 hypothetical protein [Paenibacillus eucommiae]
MPGFTPSSKLKRNSQSLLEPMPTPALQKVSKSMVIESGLHFLKEAGTDQICRVCIRNGGSCCNGCRHLSNGFGCQLRNTSCTAWLCGFLKFVLYEMELLEGWNEFWEQVPGQDYREDFTPDFFTTHTSLSACDTRLVSEALAADLQELAEGHIAIGFILTLREKIDKNMDQLLVHRHDKEKISKIKRNIRLLSSPFYRFHKACAAYKQQQKQQLQQ